MKIDNKIIDIGLNREMIFYLLNKTKKHKNVIPTSARLAQGNQITGYYCIKITFENHFRREITLHLTHNRVIELKREDKINKIIGN